MQLIKDQNASQNASERASYLTEIRFRPGGFAPLVPLPGLCPGPTGGLGGPQTPCLLCFHIVIALATPLTAKYFVKIIRCLVDFVLRSHLRQCDYVLFVVGEGWLLFDIGWFVLLLYNIQTKKFV